MHQIFQIVIDVNIIFGMCFSTAALMLMLHTCTNTMSKWWYLMVSYGVMFVVVVVVLVARYIDD